MKLQRFTFWAFMFTAMCEALAGLRDMFAPGFFTMSGQKMSGGDIALEFAIAVTFFVVGLSFSRRNQEKQRSKKNHS